jgi:hypothetical protein
MHSAIPRAVHFVDNHKDILVFGLESGLVYVFEIQECCRANCELVVRVMK